MKTFLRLALIVLTAGAAFAQGGAPAKSDADIVQALIKASIASYSGNCPCPYNTDRAGRKCGRRSAYERPGGKAPLCYPSDVTSKMIAAYRQKPKG